VFEVLRDRKLSRELQRALILTPFSYKEYQEVYTPTKDRLEQARRSIFRSYASIGTDGVSRGRAGFRALKNYESALTTAHEWENYPKEIKAFCLQLQGVVIDGRDALRILEVYDSPKTLFYLDPPYLLESRKQKRKLYRKEYTEQDHIDLAKKLHVIQGMAIISHYDCELYRELYKDWSFDSCAARIQGNGPSIEWLWSSPNIKKHQPSLF
jgi:DNA adenine methylase